MGSAINEIYDAIAAFDLYYDSNVAVTVHEIQGLKNFTGTPETPVRILSNITDEAGGASGHIALGNTVRADWIISDLLLIRPTAHGGALRNSSPQIQNYVKRYIEVVRTNRSPTTQSAIENIDWSAGTFTYGDNVEYYGVECVLEVFEILT